MIWGTSQMTDKKSLLHNKGLLAGVAVVALVGVGAAAWSMGAFNGSGGGGMATEIDLGLMPVSYGENCGFVDEDGKIVINPQFDGAGFFTRDGVAPVSNGGKWGLIDRKGSYVVNPQFDSILMLDGGDTLLVEVGGQWGTADRKGAYIINPQFDEMGPFDPKGRALVQSGDQYGFIDRKGAYIINPQFDSVAMSSEDDMTEIVYFTKGLAAASTDRKWGFIDESGKWVINPQYTAVGQFGENGLAPVLVTTVETTENTRAAEAWEQRQQSAEQRAASWGYSYERPDRPDFMEETETHRWGFINTSGELVIQPQWEQAGGFGAGGLAPVLVGEDWGFIDAEGNLKINPQFDMVGEFADGPGGVVATVAVQGDRNSYRWGVIDAEGTYKINPQFRAISDFDANGRAVVSSGDKFGMIDGSGTYVINPMYDDLRPITGSRDYFFIRGTGDAVEMGRVSRDGKELASVNGQQCDSPY